MGLSDRDYMHERREPHFGNSSGNAELFQKSTNSRQQLLWTVLTWLAVFYLLFKAFHWWELKRIHPPAVTPNFTQAPTPVPNKITGVPAATHIKESRPSSNPIANNALQDRQDNWSAENGTKRAITRCEVNGSITFTDQECHSSAKRSIVTVNVAKLGTIAPTPRTQPNEFSQSVQQPPVDVAQQTASTSPAPSPAQMKAAECFYIKQRIEQIDSLARQPLSGVAQDQLTTERKKLRDRQFALSC